MRNFGSTHLLPLALLAAGFCLPASVVGAAVIPVTGGQVSGYGTFANGFDIQPLTDPVAGPTTYADTTAASLVYAGSPARAGYVDFGTNYNDVSITGVFELLKQYFSATTGTLDYWWASDNSATAFNNKTGYVVAPDFGLFNTSGSNGAEEWVQIYSDPAGVTPEARYLIVSYEVGAVQTNGLDEFVFTSDPTAVPEPASLALLALGGLGLLHRRRVHV